METDVVRGLFFFFLKSSRVRLSQRDPGSVAAYPVLPPLPYAQCFLLQCWGGGQGNFTGGWEQGSPSRLFRRV